MTISLAGERHFRGLAGTNSSEKFFVMEWSTMVGSFPKKFSLAIGLGEKILGHILIFAPKIAQKITYGQ